MKKFSTRPSISLPVFTPRASTISAAIALALFATHTPMVCAQAKPNQVATAAAAPEAKTTGNVIDIRKDAPDSYTVVKGDTLWAISARFLASPWRWPEVWQLNKEQIRDPHWIYPGNIVYLDKTGATPRLRLGKAVGDASDGDVAKLGPMVRSTPVELAAITSIDMQAIRPFLTQHMVLGENDFKASPRIFASPDGRVYLTRGDVGYVRNLPDDGNTEYQIYRNAKPLLDPVTRKPLAYEALLIGSAVLERRGDPSTIRLTSFSEEIGPGDRLVPASKADPIRTMPRAPSKAVEGTILAIHRGVYAAGKNSVLALSSGRNNGLEVGHVLNIRQKGAQAFDREDRNKVIQLPDETAGTVFIFRVFENVSYGLIMNATRQVSIGDKVVNPE